jgi:uncharacterized protein (TIGR03083 family)
MPLDRTWLLGVARHERDALGRTVQYTPPDRWESPSPAEGWRARDVVAHLGSTEVAAAQTIVADDRTEFEEFVKETGARHFTVEGFHGWNAWAVAKRADAPIVRLAIEWGVAADLLLKRAADLSEERWGEKVPWPVDALRIPFFIQSRICEWWVHGEDVRAAVGLMSRREHPPIFCVADLAIRTIPYALQLEGLQFPGKTVLIELDGVGEGSWRQALAVGGAKPTEDTVPDVIIQGRGHAFAQVAGHRADPDEMLYEGWLLVGGDQEIAEAILRNLRYFA